MYITLDLATTKKGNHALETHGADLVLDKNGNIEKAIFIKGNDKFFASKVGTFIVTTIKEQVVILQIAKIIRSIEKGYENIRIQEVPADAISYKAVVYILNRYSQGEWEFPLIDRIKYEVQNYIEEIQECY